MKNSIELFVPGRLCLFGEHSDWASEYRTVNKEIEKGYAIVTGIDQGIYATVTKASSFIISDGEKRFQCDVELNSLQKVIQNNSYYSYVAGVFYYMLDHYSIGGIEITITKKTLPEKKGLSSSAAICVLIARTLNQLYHLGLTVEDEMKIAYHGERYCSKCGKIDQVCAYGKKMSLMEFDGGDVSISPLIVGKDLYFVFADLNASKDTKNILDSLNSCYPFPKNTLDERVVSYLGEENKKIIRKAVKLFQEGNAKELGKLMSCTQKKFDDSLISACSYLEAPKLHEILTDAFVLSHSYGGKGIGSGGDGSIQFIVKNNADQKKLMQYLEKEFSCTAYSLVLRKTHNIKKAVIPLAGMGTRMYPFTKSIPKAFLPVLDHDILKPTFMILLEELYDAGISEIALVIDRQTQSVFDSFFSNYQQEDKLDSLSKSYEKKIQEIAKTITYIYQEEKLGLGYALSLCEEFVDKEPFIMVLGDQVCKSHSDISCLQQLINQYQKTKKTTISACLTPLEEVEKYGVLVGKLKNSRDNFFSLDKIVEKPSRKEAEKSLYVRRDEKKEFYTIFGQYILPPEIFDFLKENIENKKLERGEYQVTSALDAMIQKHGGYAFIPDGSMYDVGNVNSYCSLLKV